MSRHPAEVAALIGALALMAAAGSADAGEHSGPPHAVFDVTIERTTENGGIESKPYRREWRDCRFLENDERAVVYIDVPAGDDYYTRQYPGHLYRGTQFGVNLRNKRALLRIYFGPRAYLYAASGAYEPVYYQRRFDGLGGRYTLEGGLRSGSFTVTAENVKIEEGFPWFDARIKKGASVTWRDCRRVMRRNIRLGLFD